MKFHDGNIEMDVKDFDVLSVTQSADGSVSIQCRLKNDHTNVIHTFNGMISETNYCQAPNVIDFVTSQMPE